MENRRVRVRITRLCSIGLGVPGRCRGGGRRRMRLRCMCPFFFSFLWVWGWRGVDEADDGLGCIIRGGRVFGGRVYDMENGFLRLALVWTCSVNDVLYYYTFYVTRNRDYSVFDVFPRIRSRNATILPSNRPFRVCANRAAASSFDTNLRTRRLKMFPNASAMTVLVRMMTL